VRSVEKKCLSDRGHEGGTRSFHQKGTHFSFVHRTVLENLDLEEFMKNQFFANPSDQSGRDALLSDEYKRLDAMTQPPEIFPLLVGELRGRLAGSKRFRSSR